MGNKISIVGAGGLGQPATLALAESWDLATELEITLIDFDKVELSNFNRQILLNKKDLGDYKVNAIKTRFDHLKAKNISINALTKQLTAENCDSLLTGTAFVIDATDNIETKLLLQAYCQKNNLGLSYAGVIANSGLLITFSPRDRSIQSFADIFGVFSEADINTQLKTCRTGGILAPVASLLGFLQASEAIRFLKESKPRSRMFRFSLTDCKINEINLTDTA